jgi:hypothetical protein
MNQILWQWNRLTAAKEHVESSRPSPFFKVDLTEGEVLEK